MNLHLSVCCGIIAAASALEQIGPRSLEQELFPYDMWNEETLLSRFTCYDERKWVLGETERLIDWYKPKIPAAPDLVNNRSPCMIDMTPIDWPVFLP